MALISGTRRVVIAAALGAALVPAIALFPYPRAPRAPRAAVVAPVVPTALPPPLRAFERPLFSQEAAAAVSADAPVLTGIAGRLDRDAVAMVRLGDGSARTLAIGEQVDGWRLESLAIDAAYFTRGRERVRVALAESEPEPPPGD